MWMYDKKLEYPIKIKKPDPKMAKMIITQYGGPDGELAASLRYLSQRFSMVTPEAKATLNDIGTEELAHLEMVGTMVKQLTENANIQEIMDGSLGPYYADHDKAVYPVSAAGVPFTAAYIQSKGDPVTDLYEDMAAEQKARSTYEYLINMAEDPDVIEPLKFLREREIVHFQRFGESLRHVQDYLENRKRFSISNTMGQKALPNLDKTNAPMKIMPAMNTMPDMRMPATPSTRTIDMGTPNMGNMPMRGMPNMGEMPMRSMPNSGTMPMTNMPDTGSMPMRSTPNMGTMPTTNMPDTGSMPMRSTPNMGTMPTTNMPNSGTMPMRSMPNSGTMPMSNMPDTGGMPMRSMPGTGTMPMTNMPNSGSMPMRSMPNSGTMPMSNTPNMGNIPMKSMPGTGAMPGNMQNMPGTAMPRSMQTPRDMYTPPRR